MGKDVVFWLAAGFGKSLRYVILRFILYRKLGRRSAWLSSLIRAGASCPKLVRLSALMQLQVGGGATNESRALCSAVRYVSWHG